jgi:hypothetical protein
MTTTKETLLDFITAFCTAALLPAADSKAKRATQWYISHLADVGPKVDVSDTLPAAKKTSRPSGAHSPARRALWLNRPAVGAWLGGRNAPKDANDIGVFYNTREFERWVANFVADDRFTAWRPGCADETIPAGSAVVHGVSGAIFWFGIRTFDEVLAAVRKSPDLFPDIALAAPKAFGPFLRLLNAEQRAYVLQERIPRVETADKSAGSVIEREASVSIDAKNARTENAANSTSPLVIGPGDDTALLQRPPSERAAVITQAIRPFAFPEVDAGWLDCLNGTAGDPTRPSSDFPTFCRDIIRREFGENAVRVSDRGDYVVQREGVTSRERLLFCYADACTLQTADTTLTRAVREAHAASRESTDAIVVCTNLPANEAIQCLQRVNVHGVANSKLLVFGAEAVRAHAALRPDLWSRHYGGSFHFQVVRGDDHFGLDRITGVLGPESTAETRKRAQDVAQEVVATANHSYDTGPILRRALTSLPIPTDRMLTPLRDIIESGVTRAQRIDDASSDAMADSIAENSHWTISGTEAATLERDILREIFSRRFPVTLTVAPRELRDSVVGDVAPLLFVTGRAGSGITSTIYLLLRRAQPLGFIIAAGTRGCALGDGVLLLDQEVACMASMIDSLADHSNAVTIVLESLELELGRASADTTLAILSATVAKSHSRKSDGHVRLIAGAPQSKDGRWNDSYGPTLRSFSRITLTADEEFYSAVLSSARSVFRRNMHDGFCIALAVRAVLNRCSLPHLLEILCDEEDVVMESALAKVSSVEELAQRRAEFDAIALEPTKTEEFLLLKILAGLSALGYGVVDPSILEAVFQRLGGQATTSYRFEALIDSLAEISWVRRVRPDSTTFTPRSRHPIVLLYADIVTPLVYTPEAINENINREFRRVFLDDILDVLSDDSAVIPAPLRAELLGGERTLSVLHFSFGRLLRAVEQAVVIADDASPLLRRYVRILAVGLRIDAAEQCLTRYEKNHGRDENARFWLLDAAAREADPERFFRYYNGLHDARVKWRALSAAAHSMAHFDWEYRRIVAFTQFGEMHPHERNEMHALASILHNSLRHRDAHDPVLDRFYVAGGFSASEVEDRIYENFLERHGAVG